jgi:hypothetical protein
MTAYIGPGASLDFWPAVQLFCAIVGLCVCGVLLWPLSKLWTKGKSIMEEMRWRRCVARQAKQATGYDLKFNALARGAGRGGDFRPGA